MDAKIISGLPGYVQIIIMVLGPVLTYLGLRHTHKKSLEERVDQYISGTLATQSTQIEKMQARQDLLQNKQDQDHERLKRLIDAYQEIRAALRYIKAQAQASQAHYEAYDKLFLANSELAQGHKDHARESMRELITTLDVLIEQTDPLDTAPGRSGEVPLV